MGRRLQAISSRPIITPYIVLQGGAAVLGVKNTKLRGYGSYLQGETPKPTRILIPIFLYPVICK